MVGNEETPPMKDTEIVESIVNAIKPWLAGYSPEIQGAVLADLLAMFLAGHVGPEAPALREEILRLHIETVRDLIPVNEKILAARIAAAKSVL
jgi:hypothetical protein